MITSYPSREYDTCALFNHLVGAAACDHVSNEQHHCVVRKVMKTWEATDPTMTAGFLLELVREEQVGHASQLQQK